MHIYIQHVLFRFRPRNVFTEKLPKHDFPIIWKNIDLSFRSINSRSSFKNKLKSYLLYYYNINVPMHCNNPICQDCHPKN